jgi:hypothetical protein
MATYRLQVQIDWPGAGGPGMNTWHARVDEPAASINNVSEALHTYYSVVCGVFHSSVVLSMQPEAIKDPYGSPQYASVAAWTTPGTCGGKMLPPATQLVTSWRTLSATRSGHGRTFLGPCGSDFSDDNGTPRDAFLGNYRDAAQALVSASLADNGWALGVYSRKDGVLRDFSSSKVRDVFAVLRSRRD